MKSFLFRLYLGLLKFALHFVRTRPDEYVILNGAGRSGSNGYIFYKYLKKNQPQIKATLVEPWPSSHLPWATWVKIGRAKYLFTTHQPFKIKKMQVCTSFWHGIPLKRMGLMAANTDYAANQKNAQLWCKSADHVTSSSALYATLMSACIGIEGKKYQETGFPRIDALYQPALSKQELLKDLFAVADSQAKIGVYMPTFRFELADREVMLQIENGNFFAFSDFDGAKLNAALASLHHYLIIKLHPYEMKMVQASRHLYSNICFLDNDYLFKKKIDLYELLGQTDYLITDFSSIYFDYLHLNKPVFFITNFLTQYEKTRGLLLTPYKKVVPGLTVNSQVELLSALMNLGQDDFQRARQYWLSLTYTVPRTENCRRVWQSLQQ